MDLYALTAGVVGAINPRQMVTVRVSTGPGTTNPDGSRTPTFAAPIQVLAQVQRLEYTDLQMEANSGMSIQGERQKIYLYGKIDGIVRSENKGGDLITLADGSIWKVAIVLEHFLNWTSALISLQNLS